MGTYEDLKAAIQQVIRTNGNNEITGALLQQTLLSIVNSIGANAAFAGIATPDTNPGTADQNVFYLATEAGTYVNFDNIIVNLGEAVILSNKSGAWQKYTSGFSTREQLAALETIIGIDLFTNKMAALRTDGSVRASVEGVDTTGFLPISGRTPITLIGGFTNLNSEIIPLAFYDAERQFISYITGNQSGFTVNIEDIPENAKYIRCTAYSGNYKPVLYGFTLGVIWESIGNSIATKGSIANGTDLNEVTINGVYLLTSDYNYENTPENTAFLFVVTIDDFTLQLIYSYSGKRLWKRRKNSRGVWEDWFLLSSLDNVATIESSLDSVDLNTIGKNATYLMDDSHEYLNAPYTGAIGFLRITTTGAYTLQEFLPFSGNKYYKRRGIVNGVWTPWGEIAGGGGTVNNITNQYEFPHYTNNYNIEVSPVINSGNDNILVSTGDETDRTADILALLNTTGICRLGNGTFYVSNLQMPDNTMIVGSGAATRIVLAEGGTYAIKMGKMCSLKDFKLVGSDGINVNENIGNRHGILWQGVYTENQSNEQQPQRGHIENLWISSFSGGGITCYDTGYGTITNLMAVNVNIWNCTVGLNISYWSEFHKFVNVRCASCYYGCINNGGNNIFESCDFSSNLGVAFLMDNSQEQSPNNSHGSAIGCVFNHTASNTGIGIKILGNQNGFIFSGCQIWYSQIYIDNSDGIVVSNTNFGYSNCNITINGEGSILFANNMFQRRPPINKANNSRTRFVNCYDRLTGLEIQI